MNAPTRTLRHLINPTRIGCSMSEDMFDTSGQHRSAFEIDGDKIAFTEGFRGLADKTQVHDRATRSGLHRNRLTHSIEVSRVGRSLGVAVGARMISWYGLHAAPSGEAFWKVDPADIGSAVASACTAHDLGNPPVGHDGEDAISAFFRDTDVGQEAVRVAGPQVGAELCLHEGNAQGFRMITRTMGWRVGGGLNLTVATLAAFGKYPFTLQPGAKKYGVHAADKPILDKVAEATRMIPTEGGYLRHPLAWLMEAADDICYLCADLEDATVIGMITPEELCQQYAKVIGEAEIEKGLAMGPLPQAIQYFRSRMIKQLINACVEIYPEIASRIDDGTLEKGAYDGGFVGHCRFGPQMQEIRSFSRSRIYQAETTQAERRLLRGAMTRAMSTLTGELLAHLDTGRETIDPTDPAFAALRLLPQCALDTHVPMTGPEALPWLMDQVTLLSDGQILDISRL